MSKECIRNCNGCAHCKISDNNINYAFCEEGIYIVNGEGDEQWDLFPKAIFHDAKYSWAEVWGALPPTVLQLLEEGDCPFRE